MNQLKYMRWKVLLVAVIVLIGGAMLLLIPGMNRETILEGIQGLSTPVFLGAFLLLPLVGAPISLFLIVAGAKFGIVQGMILSSGCMLLHNAAAFWFTHTFLKRRIRGFLKRMGYSIPDVPNHHQVWFTAAFTGIPGIPYTPKLYLLALTNIPFRIYAGVGWPVYSLCNIVFVGLGGLVLDIDWKWIALFVVIAGAMVGVSLWLKKRLDARLTSREESSSRTS